MSLKKIKYNFASGVHFNDELWFKSYKLKLTLYSNTDVPRYQTVALERVMHFIQDVIQKGIFVSENETSVIDRYVNAEIPVFTVPSSLPYDAFILAVLATKINAIMEDSLILYLAELSSVLDDNITHIWDYNDEEDRIHQMINNENQCKWWAVPSLRFFSLPDGTRVTDIDEAKLGVLQWEELFLGWEQDDEDDTSVQGIDPSQKVIRFDFSKNETR